MRNYWWIYSEAQKEWSLIRKKHLALWMFLNRHDVTKLAEAPQERQMSKTLLATKKFGVRLQETRRA